MRASLVLHAYRYSPLYQIQSFLLRLISFLRFGALKAYVLAKGLALTLKVLDGGTENAVDTLLDNKVMTASVLAGLYIVYG